MRIVTAYDAFWFLHEHPKFKCREARLVTSEQAKPKNLKLSKGERIRKVKDDMPWRNKDIYLLHEFALTRDAMDCNLDIFYTKVDDKRVVNGDSVKNKFIECWLEFGRIEQSVSDGVLHIKNYHDIKLDCGASTFDEALVKLARRVKKHYGDIPTPKWVAG